MACTDKTTKTADATVAALTDFKNPYAPTNVAVTKGATAALASAVQGNTVVSQSTTEVTVSTMVKTGEVKTNKISIE